MGLTKKSQLSFFWCFLTTDLFETEEPQATGCLCTSDLQPCTQLHLLCPAVCRLTLCAAQNQATVAHRLMDKGQLLSDFLFDLLPSDQYSHKPKCWTEMCEHHFGLPACPDGPAGCPHSVSLPY